MDTTTTTTTTTVGSTIHGVLPLSSEAGPVSSSSSALLSSHHCDKCHQVFHMSALEFLRHKRSHDH
jgi:hypothetical protein